MIFLGIKYEPLSDPPPIIKICEWGPWDLPPNPLYICILGKFPIVVDIHITGRNYIRVVSYRDDVFASGCSYSGPLCMFNMTMYKILANFDDSGPALLKYLRV